MAEDVVIAGAARTAMGGFQGVFAGTDAATLGGAAIAAALADAGARPDQVEELLMGCVLPAGQGQAPARQAGFRAGLPEGLQQVDHPCTQNCRQPPLLHACCTLQCCRMLAPPQSPGSSSDGQSEAIPWPLPTRHRRHPAMSGADERPSNPTCWSKT